MPWPIRNRTASPPAQSSCVMCLPQASLSYSAALLYVKAMAMSCSVPGSQNYDESWEPCPAKICTAASPPFGLSRTTPIAHGVHRAVHGLGLHAPLHLVKQRAACLDNGSLSARDSWVIFDLARDRFPRTDVCPCRSAQPLAHNLHHNDDRPQLFSSSSCS
jgi:hypothetical protein